MDEFEDEDNITVLPCKHIFKSEFINTWLTNDSYKCPICRNEVGEYEAKI